MQHRFLDILLRLALFVLSLCLLGAALAPYISPEVWLLPAFLGLNYPILLALYMVLVTFYLLTGKRKSRFLFLLIPFFTANLFLNHFGLRFRTNNKQAEENSLTFITYNVHMFNHATAFDRGVHSEILELLNREQPDILVMQDFYSAERGTKNVVDDLERIMETRHYYRGPDKPGVFPVQALMSFSRLPIINKGYIMLAHPNSGNQCLYIDVQGSNSIFRVYNVHLESLGFQQADYEEWRNADVIGKIKFLYKANQRFADAFAARSRQVEKVKMHAAACPFPYIIAGDFNDTPASYAINQMGQNLQNAFRRKGRGYTVTYNGGLPDFQIDYVFATPHFKILNYQVIKEKLSDHYPVKVELQLN